MQAHNHDLGFGQWVKQRRTWLALTQAQLAQTIGCAVITVQKIEASDLRPSIQIAKQLAAVLQIPIEEQPRFIDAARAMVVRAKASKPAKPSASTVAATVTSLKQLVGRDKDLLAVVDCLTTPQIRLLTLVGPPGVGKTRLALAAVEALREHGAFADGIITLELADVQTPQRISSILAHALQLPESAHPNLDEKIAFALREKQMLLVFDNFEHLLLAATLLLGLLAAVPHLKILVTSRTALRITHEREYPVVPLALPERDKIYLPEQLAQHAAVALFVTRAKQTLPDFTLDVGNAHAIAELCIRLDGLPLAIELAAAKCRFFSPETLLQRLGQRLPWLESRDPRLPARQRRLRDAIAWSFLQLDAPAQALFTHLGVFAGGWSTEAVEAISPNTFELMEQLTALLDNSLIVQRASINHVPRFGMLETLREFALEQLIANGEHAAIAKRHLTYFLKVAHENEMQMLSPRQKEVLDALEGDHDNFRAALRWGLQYDGAHALELSGRLYFFWQLRSYCQEGYTWLQQALALDLPLETSEQKINRARALYGFGSLAYQLSEYQQATKAHQQALVIRREMGDVRSQATLLNALGQIADQQGELDRAEQLWTDGFGLAQSIDDKPRMTATLANLGEAAYKRGDYPLAISRHIHALALARLVGSKYNIALELHELGNVELAIGNTDAATRYQEEALALGREIGDLSTVAFILVSLGEIAQQRHDLVLAETLFAESLQMRRTIGNRWGVAVSLAHLGEAAAMSGNRGHAMALLQESATLLEELGDAPLLAKVRQTLAQLVDLGSSLS